MASGVLTVDCRRFFSAELGALDVVAATGVVFRPLRERARKHEHVFIL